MNKKLIFVLRQYRIISILLTAFVMFWGYEAFLFMNSHYIDMPNFVVLFYTSIVGLSGWVVKNWMTTKHNDSMPESEPSNKEEF